MCGLLVISAMALCLVLLSMTETLATGNDGRATSAFYAAQAGLDRAIADLSDAPDWDQVLAGTLLSGFTDGPPGGERVLADGRRISLDAVVNLANCGRAVACTPAEMDAVTLERPWGRNNPRWRLFGHGPLGGILVPPEPAAGEYLVVLVADDPYESDDDPSRDGRAGSAGAGVILVRAEAFGPDGAHRVVEGTLARGAPASAGAGYAAQRGEGGVAEDGAAGSIQVPGGAITRTEISDAGVTRQ
jgi:hypothetical protein